jgi:hypothetical protein
MRAIHLKAGVLLGVGHNRHSNWSQFEGDLGNTKEGGAFLEWPHATNYPNLGGHLYFPLYTTYTSL